MVGTRSAFYQITCSWRGIEVSKDDILKWITAKQEEGRQITPEDICLYLKETIATCSRQQAWVNPNFSPGSSEQPPGILISADKRLGDTDPDCRMEQQHRQHHPQVEQANDVQREIILIDDDDAKEPGHKRLRLDLNEPYNPDTEGGI